MFLAVAVTDSFVEHDVNKAVKVTRRTGILTGNILPGE
jgi:hypothetical protein